MENNAHIEQEQQVTWIKLNIELELLKVFLQTISFPCLSDFQLLTKPKASILYFILSKDIGNFHVFGLMGKKSFHSKERFNYHHQFLFITDADSAQNRLCCVPGSHFNHNSEKYDCRQCCSDALFPWIFGKYHQGEMFQPLTIYDFFFFFKKCCAYMGDRNIISIFRPRLS